MFFSVRLLELPAAARALLLFMAAVVCLGVRTDTGPAIARSLLQLPRLTLWVWERPEWLGDLDPATTAVAVLDQTIHIDAEGRVRGKLRPYSVTLPAGTQRIAVVRIEAATGLEPWDESREQALDLLLESAWRPDIRAFQVDFDATRSQRAFYRRLLLDLRRKMPPNLPLSMTALASWCSWDDWIRDLPVDEAVPMFFRMEPDRHHDVAVRAEYRVREPLCMGSVGLSTHEAAPTEGDSGRRVYLFPDLGWRRDAPVLAARAAFWRLR